MLTRQASMAIKNIHSIQYFALDVFATDILLPGEGCLGDVSVIFPVWVEKQTDVQTSVQVESAE